MIFDANTTSLGSSIPMAEGYDGTVGVAKALIESARNDYAMFRAMLNADARELSLRKSGYVAESEILALQEATSGGIFKKIADLFKKLIAKIKGIFAKFLAKFRSLYMSDKKLIKEYGDQITRKSNIGKMEIKWRKTKIGTDKFDKLNPANQVNKLAGAVDPTKWDADVDKRWENITETLDGIKKKCSNAAEVEEVLEDLTWEDSSPEKYECKDIFSGGRDIVSRLDGFSKIISDYEKSVNKTTNELSKKVKEYDTTANTKAKEFINADKTNKTAYDNAETASTNANLEYDMAVVVNDVMLTMYNFYIDAGKEMYKQTKAVFMKAATVNNDKLAESSIYAQAVAEAAEQEVEDVISGALDADGREMLASTSIADQDLNPGDGYELGYSPNKYSDDYVTPDEAGEKKSTIVGTEESSIFSSLLY